MEMGFPTFIIALKSETLAYN